MAIKFFYDLETTGLDPRRNAVHHISGAIEVDGNITDIVDLRFQPNAKAIVDPDALAVCNLTLEELQSRTMDMAEAYAQLRRILLKYVDPYDKANKIHLAGYNNRNFDDVFLRAFFEQNGDKFFGSFFWSDSIDVMVLASDYLAEERHIMPSFKLKTVARHLGIVVEEAKLHDAQYDIELTMQIYYTIKM